MNVNGNYHNQPDDEWSKHESSFLALAEKAYAGFAELAQRAYSDVFRKPDGREATQPGGTQ